MEHLDVLGPGGEVVGRASRRRVHEEGLWHRAVHVFVLDGDGRLYLQERSPSKDLYPGLWTSSASGHVDAGEAWEDAAMRELEEELGVVAPVDELATFRYDGGTDRELSRLYEARHEGPFDPDPEEVAGGRWVTVPAVVREVEDRPEAFAPTFALALERFGSDRT